MPEASLAALVLIVALALVFDYINGFHDTANAIAAAIGTRALSPAVAISLAAVFNVVGALSGTAVAATVGRGIVSPDVTTHLLVVAALISAILWNLFTWRLGIPSSSSHALIFSLVGAGVASAGWGAVEFGGVDKVLEGLILSPPLGFAAATALLIGLLWLLVKARPHWVNVTFKRLQILSSAYIAFSHGGNDAQKTMGIITMALASTYGWSGSAWHVPLWVILASASAMGLGTALGGWRIIRTVGLNIVALRPVDGFTAQVAAASVIEVASRLGIPVSTTQVISSAIMGAGATKRVSAVRWGIAGRILAAWVITLPACTLLGWLIYGLLHLTGLR
jgi:PiT family inorganic phosphate transporter